MGGAACPLVGACGCGAGSAAPFGRKALTIASNGSVDVAAAGCCACARVGGVRRGNCGSAGSTPAARSALRWRADGLRSCGVPSSPGWGGAAGCGAGTAAAGSPRPRSSASPSFSDRLPVPILRAAGLRAPGAAAGSIAGSAGIAAGGGALLAGAPVLSLIGFSLRDQAAKFFVELPLGPRPLLLGRWLALRLRRRAEQLGLLTHWRAPGAVPPRCH